MKTKSTFLVIFSMLLLASTGLMGSCIDFKGIKGDGNVVKEARSVSGFSGLEVSGAFHVMLKQDNSESLTVEADQNLMQYIKTEVRDGHLRIYSEENLDPTCLNIYLTFIALDMMDFSGVVEATGEGKLSFDKLYIDGSGASDIRLDMDANEFRADFSGATEIELAGKAGSAIFDLSGAGEIDAYDFIVADCEIDVSGASEVRIHVTDNLEVDISGAASVRYKGDPRVKSDISGAGSLKAY